MSTGKISKPINAKTSNEALTQLVTNLVYETVQTCEVHVDNSKLEGSLQKQLASIETRIETITTKIGHTEGNIGKDIQSIKAEVELIKTRKPTEIAVSINNAPYKTIGIQHFQFASLLKILATKLNVYLVGPAGSGKTTAAMHCAQALGVEFHFTGAVASEFKLTGFINAQGGLVSTEFRKAYEKGGLFLFDEIDASYPQAILAFNAALANDYMDFPDKRVQRHADFYCIAAANTFGQGADRQYIGRNQLDAASLDRFVFFNWENDEKLEREIAGNHKWVDYVQEIRKVIHQLKIRHVVSPRASIFGAKLLASGLEEAEVKKMVLWKGLDEATINKITTNSKFR